MSSSSSTNNKELEETNPNYWDLNEEEETEAYSSALSIFTDSIKFEVLKAVIELGVLEIINKSGPHAHLSAVEIAVKLSTQKSEVVAPTLGRLLEYLVSHSVFTVSAIKLGDGRVERRYGLAPICKFLTPNHNGVSLAALFDTSVCKAFKESCLFLKDAVLEGKEPFPKAHGMTMFEYIGQNSEFRNGFHKIMYHHSTLVMHEILKKYNGFEGLSTLIDVGGSTGASLNIITTKYPTIKGINYEQPHVIANAPAYPGVEHVGGDMFVSIPKGDAIFLKWICHCFNDENCITILRNCYAALPENDGKVILCEYLLPDPHETSNNIADASVVQFDMIMMVSPAGKERTKEEFEALAFGAGFQALQVVCSVYNIKIIELLKRI